MSRFNQQNAMPTDEGVQVKATVKWFNVSKGFGFVSPEDGSPDAFLHVSVLNRAGLQTLPEGAEILCFIAQGQKGPQVTRIAEVLKMPEGGSSGEGGGGGGGRGGPRRNRYRDEADSSNDGGMEFSDAPRGPEVEVSGVVKWFKSEKGFGFVTPSDSDKDVFVHKNVLRRCGLSYLEPGQKVQMRVQDAQKGREATWISASDGQD